MKVLLYTFRQLFCVKPMQLLGDCHRKISSSKVCYGYVVNEKVKSALKYRQPIVALESTIITHGMPYPQNSRTASDVEEIIVNNGATPATVAVIAGQVHVGLDYDQIEWLAAKAKDCIKVSRRDLPLVTSQGLTGGTTVSGTMLVAHHVGIPVFVTGGIGGVHRGAETSFDVSADLRELGRTPVTVVSSGVKSILDIEKTLEYLETEGVCVAVFGPSCDFPAFFTPSSGYQAPYCIQTAKEAADMIVSHQDLGLQSGILIAVPIPKTTVTGDLGDIIEVVVQQAVEEAKLKGVSGKAVTPFILERVNKLTDGKSLEANKALIQNNAQIGAQIAVELSQIRSKQTPRQNAMNSKRYEAFERHINTADTTRTRAKCMVDHSRPVVIGGSIADTVVTFKQDGNQLTHSGATYSASFKQSYGGVGRNMADALARLQCNPLFVSAIGKDDSGRSLLNYCSHMDHRGIQEIPDASTASYIAVLKSSGELLYGLGDMDIHNEITVDYVSGFVDDLKKAPIVLMDGNIPVETMDFICQVCQEAAVPVFFEPTDVHKAKTPFETANWKPAIHFISPNVRELHQIHSLFTAKVLIQEDLDGMSIQDLLHCVITLCQPLLDHVPHILVTLGQHGVLLATRQPHQDTFHLGAKYQEKTNKGNNSSLPSYVHYQTHPVGRDAHHIVSVSGAGDSFNGGVVYGMLHGLSIDDCIKRGLMCAHLSLQSHHPVSHLISPNTLHSEVLKWTNVEPNIIQV